MSWPGTIFDFSKHHSMEKREWQMCIHFPVYIFLSPGPEIDRGFRQAVPYRALAGQFDLAPAALCRHRQHPAGAF
jgi:hypothetical protein